MKYTLLELTKLVLSSIDGDEVTSITDTTEADQVVNIIKRCYGNLVNTVDYPERKTLFGLTASADLSKPTLMYLPSAIITTLDWVKYNCQKLGDTDSDFQLIEEVEIDEFFRRMHSLSPSADTSLTSYTHTVNGLDITFTVRNDIGPSYFASWDDSTIVFNSYDAAVDTVLQSSKTLCYGEIAPTWVQSDSFVVPFDDHQLLLNESIAWAWAELKQASNAKAEREARNQLVSTARDKSAIVGADNFTIKTFDFGRKR